MGMVDRCDCRQLCRNERKMIRINQLKLPVEHGPEEIKIKAAKMLRLPPEAIRQVYIRRQSLDARKKPELYYSYVVDVELAAGGEGKMVHKLKNPNIMPAQENAYVFPEPESRGYGNPMSARPVIIGTGPAGLFCGLMLARHGFCPLLLERGDDVDTRRQKVEAFWLNGSLDRHSNVQFGEGGAGTFSDGKLNTLVKDPAGRNRLVLEIFVEFGADPAILYQQKPHIGTDVLSGIVKNIRQEIIRLGGEVRFGCPVTDLITEEERLTGVVTAAGEQILTDTVVLAIGHSARDTFEMLYRRQVPMDQKAFAVGLRIQHPQSMINFSQYGRSLADRLGAASYKLTWQTKGLHSGGRGVYSFCMCPGGYVVNASSEPGRLAVNGMSYHSRAGQNANSALIVTVTPADFPDRTPLGGVACQRELERLAFAGAGGRIPVQLYHDFAANRISTAIGDVIPQMKGEWSFANLRQVLPETFNQALLEAMKEFGTMIQGFDRPDAVLAGVESRTSSPVRIWRDDTLESRLKGLYPCGEGAGYAGGITSAAMDGVKAAEAVARRRCRPI